MVKNIIIFTISCFLLVNCQTNRKPSTEFVGKCNQIVADFENTHKLDSKFDKKFKEKVLSKDKREETIYGLYSTFKQVGCDNEEPMLKIIKTGLEDIYVFRDTLLKQMIKIYPEILNDDSHYLLNFSVFSKDMCNDKQQLNKKFYIDYNGVKYSLDKDGKMYKIQSLNQTFYIDGVKYSLDEEGKIYQISEK